MHIGNYGWNEVESDSIKISGLICKILVLIILPDASESLSLL
jgi:hypothetical protein